MPSDPSVVDPFRTRRAVLSGFGGFLFLPSQGLFLMQAIRSAQPLLWVLWAVVLAVLVGAAVTGSREDDRRGRAAAPQTPGPLLLSEVVALVLGLALTLAVR